MDIAVIGAKKIQYKVSDTIVKFVQITIYAYNALLLKSMSIHCKKYKFLNAIKKVYKL
jgi:hypothetical protein